MSGDELEADRSAHRVADRNDRREPELADYGGGIIGTLGQGERTAVSDTAPVALVVDSDEGVAECESFKGRIPLEIGARRPAVKEQQHGSGRVGVTVDSAEDLAATGDEHDLGRRQRGRRWMADPGRGLGR